MIDQKIRKNDTAVTFAQGRSHEVYASTGRTNINEINKRNAEQEKQEKKSSYTMAGIVIFLIVFIMLALNFLS
jgi:hypothetical protein